MAQLFKTPRYTPISYLGETLPGAQLYFYEAGSSTPKPTFVDSDLTVSHPHPVRADGAGVFPPIWLEGTYDVELLDADNVTQWPRTSASEVLAASTITDLIAGQTAAEIAAGVTPVTTAYPPLNVRRYGALGDGVTNDAAAFGDLVSVARQMTAPELLIPDGDYSVTSPLVFNVPHKSTIRFVGSIASTVAGTAVQIGSTTANTHELVVEGLKVRRTSNDTSGASVGISLMRLIWGKVDIRECTGFREGVVCNGYNDGAFSHNDVTLGLIHDNRTNLRLTASGSLGYCNENRFYGGSYSHSLAYDAVATTNLLVDDFSSGASGGLNNNRFFGPSLEDHQALAVAASISGFNNVIYWPRVERSTDQATYEIQFTANAEECAVVGHGFTMLNTNIDDLGSGNQYETREGRVFKSGTPNTAGKGVLDLQSTNTSTARLLRGLDINGAQVFEMTGEGHVRTSGYIKTSAAPSAGEVNFLTLGAQSQGTVGAAGGASALPATPTGYLRFFLGTTEYVLPYYARA